MGDLGKHVVQELVEQGFEVTILKRRSDASNAPKGVRAVHSADYDDVESLRSLLAGQDAVVSTLGSAALGAQQRNLADAALAAGIRRFIPSEFGINTRGVRGETIGKIVAAKTSQVDDLMIKSEQNPHFTWTGLSNGMFFDFLGLNMQDKTFHMVDSGNEPFQTSTRSAVAKAVASVLKHPQETANQYLRIASFQPTQHELLKLAEEETGAKFTVIHDSSSELRKLGEDKFSHGDYSAFLELVQVHLYADGVGHAVQDSEKANKLLGLPEEDIREAIRKYYPA